MVKNFKLHCLKAENDDTYFMLLALRSIAFENGFSPDGKDTYEFPFQQ